MDTALVTRWVEALESDEYVQGQGKLCRDYALRKRYCCLGVAATLAWGEPSCQIEDLADDLSSVYGWDRGGVVLRNTINAELSEVLGLSNSDIDTLIHHNDWNSKTFKEIAQWIRVKHLK